MRTCGSCHYFRICRNENCFVTASQAKCLFPRANGSSRWKLRKLRRGEKRKG